MDTYYGVLRFNSKIAIVLLMMGAYQSVLAQFRVVPTINEVQEFTLPAVPAVPTFIHFSTAKNLDLLYYDGQHSQMMIALNEGSGGFTRHRPIFSVHPLTSFTAGNLNNDGIDDIVIVQREQNKIIVLLSNGSDSVYSSVTFTVNYYPERAVIGDLTGDNIPDIITYGRLSSGISYLRGKGKNKFNDPKTLFASLPVSFFSIIHLNADNLPDVVLRNWLHNEDVFYFGIGKTRFSEQSALTYGDDSTLTVFYDFNMDGVTDAVVVSSQFRNVQVYHGSGLANVVLEQNLSLLQSIGSVSVVQFQEHGSPNLLLTSASNNDFSLLMNKGNGTFYDEIVFGMPYESNRIIPCDINGDGRTDIVCFDDSSNHYTVFWNALSRVNPGRTKTIAVGKNPSNLSAVDLNGDGFDDLLISNDRSNTLSLLFGSKRGIENQLSVETSDAPSFATMYAKNDTAVIILTAHERTSKVGVTTLIQQNDPSYSLVGEVESYTIQLSAPPAYVMPDLSVNKQLISLYVFLRAQNNPIIFYQQLQGTQFVAKSLTPLIPSRILFATISDLNSDNYSDLIYLYTDTTQASDFLGITLNDKEDEFKGKTFSYAIPDSGNKRAFIYVEDMNSDQKKDYLLYLPFSERLYLITGKQNGEISTGNKIADHVAISTYSHLQIYDYNTDGINDIMYFDSSTLNVMFLRGKGNGSFYSPRQILRLPKESIFQCGDFNGDGRTDIACTQSSGHTVSIFYGE